MRSISGRVAEILETHGAIQENDVDECRYGLEVFISSAFEVLSILFISIFVRNFVETLLFFAAFIPLRIYAGGYHAGTKLRCYLVSLATYAAFALVLYILPDDIYLITVGAEVLFALVMVLAFAPIIHYNKNVNYIEISNYRKISVAICIIQIALILVFTIIFKANRFVLSFALGQLAESLSMAVVVVKKHIFKSK